MSIEAFRNGEATIVRAIYLAAALLVTTVSACVYTPAPLSLSHDLPPVEASGRNHLSASVGNVGAGICVGQPHGCAYPTQIAYGRQFGDDLHLGVTQSFWHLLSGPQTRLLAAYDGPDHWLPHTALGVGWQSSRDFPDYFTQEFGVRRSFVTDWGAFYVDPVVSLSSPIPASTAAFAHVHLNAGVEYAVTERLRWTIGPTVVRAQPLNGASGIFGSGISTGLTYSR